MIGWMSNETNHIIDDNYLKGYLSGKTEREKKGKKQYLPPCILHWDMI